MKTKNKILFTLNAIAMFIIISSVDIIVDFQFGIKMIPAIISMIYVVTFLLVNR